MRPEIAGGALLVRGELRAVRGIYEVQLEPAVGAGYAGVGDAGDGRLVDSVIL